RAIGVLRAKLLLGRVHFDRHFSGHISRPLADNLADLAHRRELFGQPGVLGAILSADAAAGIVAGLLIGALAAALTLGALASLGVTARLPVLRVGGLPPPFLLALPGRSLLIPLPLLRFLPAVLPGLRLRFLPAVLRPHTGQQILHRVLDLGRKT